MNLLLLEPEDFSSATTVVLRGRRARHALEVLSAQPGDSFRVGVRGGRVGLGTVLEKAEAALWLAVELTEPPPPRAPVDVVLAIPRPKALRRLLPALASMGISRLALVNAARVEKSYFQSELLQPDELQHRLSLGLEQGRDTIAPEVSVHKRFRPFVEDELGAFCGDAVRLVPHPGAPEALSPLGAGQRAVVAIGPEGGWVPFELELLAVAGFRAVSLGSRPLRVEVVVPAIVGALGALR